jgi:hypothetical protein
MVLYLAFQPEPTNLADEGDYEVVAMVVPGKD